MIPRKREEGVDHHNDDDDDGDDRGNADLCWWQ